MKKIFTFSILASFFLLTTTGYSQQVKNYSKASDYILQKKVAENPDIINKYIIYESEFKKIIEDVKAGKHNSRTDTLINGRRVIPVVFHIIHKGGPENISKAQVLDAIKLINIDYNKLNADTVSTYPLFKSRIANIQIEFRLAKIDPNGNCTEGIDRVYDPQTNYGYFSTMHQYNWDPKKYLNVYAVNYIYPSGMSLPDGAFIGGMSPFPPSNTLSSALTGGDSLVDGVLIRQDCIGSIGTATDLAGMGIDMENRTFTHEAGHYFNLYHPFQNLILGIYPASSGCYSTIAPNGDQVDDTPFEGSAAQNSSISCLTPGSRNSCNYAETAYGGVDAPDMVENYMDYQWGYCSNLFTLNQLDRINASLIADRTELYSKENLMATGVLDSLPVLCAPIADFYPNKFMVCKGGSVTFTDYSYSGAAQNWQWNFNGGTPATSGIENPTVQYNTPGVYSVSLKATNSVGSDSIIKTNYIVVINDTVSQVTPFTESFETANLATNWYINNDIGNQWEISDSAAFTGSKSLRIANYYNNSPGSYDEIITPTYDLSNLPSPCRLKFQLAYSGRAIPASTGVAADTAYDALKILASTDCGATWTQRYNKTGIALTTCNPVQGNYIPASTADWRQELIVLSGLAGNDNVRFKFQLHSNGGNNLYIDDINLTSPNYGIEDNLLSDLNFAIQPNPVNENSVISFDLQKENKVKLSIYNLLGEEIMTIANSSLAAGKHTYTINHDNFGNAGFYFVKISVDGQIMTKKIIVN